MKTYTNDRVGLCRIYVVVKECVNFSDLVTLSLDDGATLGEE